MSLPDDDAKSRRIKITSRPVSAPVLPGQNPFAHSRGYLPHRDDEHRAQILTLCLADSIPRKVLLNLLAERDARPAEDHARDADFRRQFEACLDSGYGSCFLGNASVAAALVDIFKADDPGSYTLIAYVVMPTHAHVLIRPARDMPLGDIVRRWKLRLNTFLHHLPSGSELPLQPKPLWQREYHDRMIRDDDHLVAAVRYIHANPVKAGLCATPDDWPWSSARDAA